MNDGSCNHMTCAVCGCEFCWLCMKEISDLHYLSPSGCTFWGKKPWSRKKKILWQLGTLIGAPVGITLIAGIAVPAMVIGIPVTLDERPGARDGNAASFKHGKERTRSARGGQDKERTEGTAQGARRQDGARRGPGPRARGPDPEREGMRSLETRPDRTRSARRGTDPERAGISLETRPDRTRSARGKRKSPGDGHNHGENSCNKRRHLDNFCSLAIHAHYELKKSSRHRRNLAITGGVALSIITAPVIAAVSVGIGVPIMLAYVYGVVPISLCRGGGCGVSRGKGRGVRIDFDEDDGPITVADAWRALKSPSLGESSLDGAVSGLSTTSPSEGVSVAPGALNETPHFNTLAGGALGTRNGKYSRLEVQAGELKEPPQRETGSLGAGSDCASTRGMAGSIISSYTLPDRECTNLEIQVDIETKPSHLCLTSEEDLTPPAALAAPVAPASAADEPQDCSSRRGGALGLSPGASVRDGLRDVTLAQPESIRSDLEMSDTQSDDIAELTSDDCDSPGPKAAPRPAAPRTPPQTAFSTVPTTWSSTSEDSKHS
ncbi:hypothetical protein WMY93_020232 [Mugilogobius chulae]|uniref:RING-type domain-containing protein n=1 Tax=Mugilogobius chulae TaxID=88201 RepID=A0AAW0NMB6_9GOBI